MATRDGFLRLIWNDVINSCMAGRWIDNTIAASARDANAPFSDVGPALQRLLALGADRRELSLIARSAAYEAAFSVLYMLCDPGIEDDDLEMLHESLLGADPSGMEGRPGSAP